MSTDVEEPADDVVRTFHDHEGLVRYYRGDVVACCFQLIGSANHLPGICKDRSQLELIDSCVGVPGRGNGEGLLEGRRRVVAVDDLLKRQGYVQKKKVRFWVTQTVSLRDRALNTTLTGTEHPQTNSLRYEIGVAVLRLGLKKGVLTICAPTR